MLQLRIFQRGLVLVGTPLLIEIALICSLFFLLYQSAQERIVETKYRSFSSEVSRLLGLVSSAPSVLAASVQFRSEKLFQEYEKQVAEIKSSLEYLEKILAEIPEIPKSDYQELERSIDAVLDVTGKIAEQRQNADSFSSIEKLEAFQKSMVKAKQVAYLHLESMFESSDRMTEAAEARLDRTRHLQILILQIGLVSNVLCAILLSLFYRASILKRIKILSENTVAIRSGKKLAAPVSGNDEIALFDQSMHQMLRQLAYAAKNENELFENASDVICVLDADHNFMRVNPASQKDWGLAAEQLISKNLCDLLTEAEFAKAELAIKDCRMNARASSFETSIETKDGRKRTGLWSVYWSESEKQLFCIVHDLTESKQIEEEKKQFLTMITSDLQTPLTKISTSFARVKAEILEDLGGSNKDKLDMTSKNIRRLLGLVNDLLAVTQMESGSFELAPQNLEIEDLLGSAASDLEALAAQKKIKIEIKVQSGLRAFFDPDKITQVLINLLSNAIKFSGTESTITISAQDADQNENGLIEVKVRDQGRGVPESHRTSIFEKFSQVDLADGKRQTGTGLGLPICKQIIEMHGGVIGVESKYGSGSTFFFSLPKTQHAAELLLKEKRDEKIKEANSSRCKDISETAGEAPKSGGLEKGSGQAEMRALNKNSSGLSLIMEKLSLQSKGSLLIATPLIIGLLLVLFCSSSLNRTEEERERELHMRKMALTASKLSKFILYSSGAVMNTVETMRWNRFKSALLACKKHEVELEALVERYPYAKKEYEKFLALGKKLSRYSTDLVKQKQQESDEGIASLLKEKIRQLPALVGVNRHLRNIIDFAESAEFTSPEKELAQRQSQSMFLLTGLIASIALSFVLAVLFSLGVSRRILIMADNAGRLANEDRLNPLLGGKDELSQIDIAFHETAMQLAEARKKERAIFDNCKDVLCVLSPSLHFLSINAACQERWGYSKKEILNLSLDQLIPDDTKEIANKFFACDDNLSASEISVELLIKTKSGTEVETLWSASCKQANENMFCVVHDISQRKALERLQKEFLAMVSHDLRTPLSAISGMIQLLHAGALGKLKDENMQVLAEIKENADSLLELINDILDLEKLEAGKMQLHREDLFLHEIIDQVLENIESAALPCQLSSILSESQEKLNLSADRERLTYAITKLARFLITHARLNSKSLEANERVQIKLSAEEKADRTIEIRILDSGPPLSPEILSEVRASSSKTPKDSSLAIPLALKTISLHNGSLSFETIDSSKNLLRIQLPEKALSSGT